MKLVNTFNEGMALNLDPQTLRPSVGTRVPFDSWIRLCLMLYPQDLKATRSNVPLQQIDIPGHVSGLKSSYAKPKEKPKFRALKTFLGLLLRYLT